MGEGEQPLRKKLRMILREISGPRRAIAVDGGRMSERRVVGVGVLVLVALVVLLRGLMVLILIFVWRFTFSSSV